MTFRTLPWLTLTLSLLTAGPSSAQVAGEPVYGGKPLSVWVKDLKSNDAQERTAAADAIGALGPRARTALPDLIAALKDEKKEFVGANCSVAIALYRVGPPEQVIPPLIEALRREEKTNGLPSCAAIALANIGPPAVPALVEALKDKRAQARRAAAFGLGMIGAGAKEAVPALGAALDDPDQQVRFCVVCALQGIGPAAKSAAPRLRVTLSQDSDENVRWAAVDAYMAIDPEGAKQLGIPR
jgi:HEAT repeat protein